MSPSLQPAIANRDALGARLAYSHAGGDRMFERHFAAYGVRMALRAGARWRPRGLTAAPTLLALMRHTVAARGNPAHSMPILKQAVRHAPALVGTRGEARRMVSAVVRHVHATMAPTRPRAGLN